MTPEVRPLSGNSGVQDRKQQNRGGASAKLRSLGATKTKKAGSDIRTALALN